jgi:hypothetical protein
MGQIGWAMGIITSAFPAMKEGGRRSWREWHWRELTSPHTQLRVVEKWKLKWW